MALKFRRRQKLFPGVYLNFSSKGISNTIGMKGFSVNINKSGTYLNTGIPGTGLYDRQKISGNQESKNSFTPNNTVDTIEYEPYIFIPKKLEGEIKSKDANEVTSQNLLDLKETLLAAYEEKREIENEISELEKSVRNARIIRIISKIFIIGFAVNWFNQNYFEKNEYLLNLREQLKECKVYIDIELVENKMDDYNLLKDCFHKLSQSNKIWDMTSSLVNTDNRSAASESVTRDETVIGLKSIPFLNADFEAMHFENKNGSDIYIYPGFVVLFDDKQNFGLVELKGLEINYSDSKFLELQNVPIDTEIIGKTWAKVNKNGTPDKRFNDNYEIPIVHYGELEFQSETGVREVFLFSNPESSRSFGEAFENYK